MSEQTPEPFPALTADDTIRLTRAASSGREDLQRIMRERAEPPAPASDLPPWATETFPDAESRAGCLAAAVRDFGLDPRMADRVRGETPLEVARDVAQLAQHFPAPPPVADLRGSLGGFAPSRARALYAAADPDQAIRDARHDNRGDNFTL